MNTKCHLLIGEDINSELPLNLPVQACVMDIPISTVMIMLFFYNLSKLNYIN